MEGSSEGAARGTPPPVRRRDVTRERLLDTAYEEFRQRGYLNTTIKGICARAGYTRGAFYSNFQTKEELFEALYFRANRKQSAQIADAVLSAIADAEANGGAIDMAGVVSGALRTVPFGAGDEVEWFGMVLELRGASVHHAESRRVLRQAEEDLFQQLQTMSEGALARTGTQLALPIRDVLVMAVGLFEHELNAVPLAPGSPGLDAGRVGNAVDALERLLRAITVRG